MKNENQVIIVGGGLAGLTAAIHLSKLGFPVTVIDKNTYPRHKVCGEYVSNEVLPYLEWLGVDIAKLHPTQITKIIVSNKSGESISSGLPLGGFGLSRYALDYKLYQKALEQNCQIIHAQVNDIDFSDNEFSVALSNNHNLKSSIVVGAFGKRSNIDLKFHRSFIQKKSHWLAVKGHYHGDFPNDVVGLHNFPGGYCGVSKIENNIINICYLADFDSFKKHKNPEDYQNIIMSKNPFLKSVFENAKPLFEKPLTISQISFDKKKCVENHVLMIGDTAGLIHPFCGNGMAMAIHSGKIASEHISKYFNNEILDRQTLEERYTSTWNYNFNKRLSVGSVLANIMRHDSFSGILMTVLLQFPTLLKRIIKMTHGKPIIINS